MAGFPGREAFALSADDVVMIMRKAGFEDAEILRLGPQLRNQIATVGGALVRSKGALEAIFAVTDDRLQVSSRRTGTFVYQPDGKGETEIVSATTMPKYELTP